MRNLTVIQRVLVIISLALGITFGNALTFHAASKKNSPPKQTTMQPAVDPQGVG